MITSTIYISTIYTAHTATHTLCACRSHTLRLVQTHTHLMETYNDVVPGSVLSMFYRSSHRNHTTLTSTVVLQYFHKDTHTYRCSLFLTLVHEDRSNRFDSNRSTQFHVLHVFLRAAQEEYTFFLMSTCAINTS